MVRSRRGQTPGTWFGIATPAAVLILSAICALSSAHAFPGQGNGSHQGPNAGHYRHGFGRTPRSDAMPFRPPSFRDASNAYVFTAGRPRSLPGGVGARAAEGAGQGGGFMDTGHGASASAIGNMLTVVVEGHGNTVIVDAEQVNEGDISASLTLEK
ncbi:MAG: hypothetical protein ACFB6R_05240 [Alphaproteobacteria bacterium]